MLESLRRTTATIFTLAALVSGITLLASEVVKCPIYSTCLGSALFTYGDGIDLGTSNSTSATLDRSIVKESVLNVSNSALLVSALLLLIFEIKKKHYLTYLKLPRIGKEGA